MPFISIVAQPNGWSKFISPERVWVDCSAFSFNTARQAHHHKPTKKMKGPRVVSILLVSACWWINVQGFVSSSHALQGQNGMPLFTSNSKLEDEIRAIEREQQASVREKMDYNQVLRALTEENAAKSSSASVPIWQVALTASMVAATASFFLFANLYVSLFVWICIFVVANADPMQDDSALGALARILGRATLKSYATSKPKLAAMARAAVNEDEVRVLTQKLQSVQAQAEELRQWKKNRLWVEDNLQSFTVEDLKQRARDNQLAVGGTKLQLLQRLVDAHVITVDD